MRDIELCASKTDKSYFQNLYNSIYLLFYLIQFTIFWDLYKRLVNTRLNSINFTSCYVNSYSITLNPLSTFSFCLILYFPIFLPTSFDMFFK